MIPLDDAVKLHEQLWVWLLEHPDASKPDWPGWKEASMEYDIPMEVFDLWGYCFACMVSKCDNCLFVWPTNSCTGKNSPYMRWRDTCDPAARRVFAALVATLPVRKEVVNENKT